MAWRDTSTREGRREKLRPGYPTIRRPRGSYGTCICSPRSPRFTWPTWTRHRSASSTRTSTSERSKYADAEGALVAPICAALEAQSPSSNPADRPEFLAGAGLREPGLYAVVRTAFELLGLITFFTAGKQEVRAWTVRRGAKAPQAAGVIHTDFEKGFIKAEVIWWEDFVKLGGGEGARRRQIGNRGKGVHRP